MIQALDSAYFSLKGMAMGGINQIIANEAETLGEELTQKVTGAEDSHLSSLSTTVEGTGNGIVRILMLILVFSLVIGLLFLAIKGSMSGSQGQAEAKASIPNKVLFAIIGLGAIAIVSLIASLASSLFTNLGN